MGLDDFIVAHGIGELRKLLDSAEEPMPPDAAIMKSHSKEIDAGPEADYFLEKTKMDGVKRLLYWCDCFFYWSHGAYSKLPLSEVRGNLIKHLDGRFSKLSMTATSNVMDTAKAKAMIGNSIDPPTWFGDKSGLWPADEVLAARNDLVHLPSLIAGKDYSMPATPRFFTISALDYDFKIDASEPKEWLEFINQLWANDPQSIEALQDWMGYLLTLDTRQQKIFFLIGPKRSGKGTIARVDSFPYWII